MSGADSPNYYSKSYFAKEIGEGNINYDSVNNEVDMIDEGSISLIYSSDIEVLSLKSNDEANYDN